MNSQMRIWSTDAVDNARRADYWVGAVCECFLDMEVEPRGRQSFGATLTSMPCDELMVNRVQGSGQRVRRTPATIRRSRHNYYYLLCKEQSPCQVSQQGSDGVRLRPGDLALIDSRRPYCLDFPQTVDIVSIQLPIGWLDTWLPAADAWLGLAIDGSQGWGRVLGAYVQQLSSASAVDAGQRHGEHLGGLLSLACGMRAQPVPRPESDLAAHIESVVRQRCTEPGLCAISVAMDLGVSVRTLHRVLARQEKTFAWLLAQYRMEAARRMLLAPAYRRLTVAEIGRRSGFLDPSHFARAYRIWAGETPAAARAST